ncbi:MAG: Ig-like domain-containing protein [Oscillospiraceae bacterium]|jgi:hypothetical protein|nr:Ig-like domain-containing protein [Oscillospiraceae bacterium]
MKASTKKRAAAATAALALIAGILTGTYAYWENSQHKTNELNGTQIHYEARLIEDYVEIDDWKVEDGEIKKEVGVANVGIAANGYGSVYARIQLKEYMEIGKSYVVETAERYMIDTEGFFITFATQALAEAAYPNHTVMYLTDKVTNTTGWFIQTKAHDPNGQYGKYVVTDAGFNAADPVIPGTVRASDDATNKHNVVANGTPPTRNGECDYPVHAWDGSVLETREYVEWTLNNPSVILMSAWDGTPTNKWIIDDTNNSGWVYWGQALQTQTQTEDFLKAVSLIKQPDGEFYYAIHVEMDAISLSELKDPNSDAWKDANQKVIDSILANAPSVIFTSAPATEVTVGGMVPPPATEVYPSTDPQTVTWSSSDTSIATVDPATGVVTGVKPGQVTIAATAQNGARAYYQIEVKANSVPALGVTINGTKPLSLIVGDERTLTATLNPANSTDTIAWSSSAPTIVSVNPTTGEIKALAAGTATITVTASSGVQDTVEITVTPQTLGVNQPADPNKGFVPYADLNDIDLSYTYVAAYDTVLASYVDFVQYGSIKLSEILSGADTSGVTVAADEVKFDGSFEIGKDKDGDDALIYKYAPTHQEWIDAMPDLPEFTTTVTLTQNGLSASIKLTMLYNHSIAW